MLVHHHCKPLLLLLVHLLLQVELRWVRDVRELRLLRMLPPTFPLAAASSASLRLRSNVHFDTGCNSFFYFIPKVYVLVPLEPASRRTFLRKNFIYSIPTLE